MMSNAAEIAEAFGEDAPQTAAPVDPELRHVVPAPADPEIEKLEAIAPRHRVLLVRAGAVIAVTTLISVGGALLLHALAAGVIVIGLLFPGMVPSVKRVGQSGAGLADVGGSPGGFTILGNGPDDNAPPAPTPPEVLGTPQNAAALPALPDVLATPATPTTPPTALIQTAMATAPALPPDLSAAPLTTPQVTAPALPSNLQVTPPGRTDNASATLNPGQPARGTGAGNGGGDEDRIMSLVKGDGSPGDGGGGIGNGRGMGHGNGIDRGLALGDRPAQQMNQASVDAKLIIPDKYVLHPPEKDITLAIAIAADGKVTSVRVQESCGVPELDELVRSYYQATVRYTPKYVDGKPVASVDVFSYTFHPFD